MDIVCKACEHEFHPHPSYICHQYMREMENPLHNGIWIFHQRSLPGYPQIPSYGFNCQFVVSHTPVHGSVVSLGIMAKISPIPENCYSVFGEINGSIMILCRGDGIGSYGGNRLIIVYDGVSLIPKIRFIVLLRM